MNPEANLAALGLTLPNPPAAAGSYVPTVRTGNLLYCAGTICMVGGQMTHTGQVGKEQTVQTANKSAEICALNTLANIKAAVGSLDQVARIVFVSGFVNAVDGFADSPAVINGASDLFLKVFGDAGKHARAAVAVNGSVENIEINRSSGQKVLDEAALQIVRLGSPYAAFPPDIAKDTDILSITRTWIFTRSDQLATE